MRKSLFRWQLRVVLLACLLLAVNAVAIQAQDVEPTPETSVASSEVTEEPTLPPTPTDLPTEIPPTEEPALPPTETPTPEVTEIPVESVTPSPEVTEVVTESPTPDETGSLPLPDTTWSILVRELFNNGDVSPWAPGVGWAIVANNQPVIPGVILPNGESDMALQVVNSNEAIQFNKETFLNVAAETSFLVSSGSAQISVRQSEPGVNYTASIDATGLVQLYRSGVVLGTAQSPATINPWRTLRLSAVNDVLRVAVDNVEVIALRDATPHLARGYVTLSGAFGDTANAADPAANTLVVDNFFIWVPLEEIGLYPVPTPIPVVTVEAPPTAVPTEEVTEAQTAEPTEIATEEATETPPTEAPTVGGKTTSPVPPPSAEELASALISGNNNFATPHVVSPLGLPFVDFGDTTTATLEGGETLPTCGLNLDRSVWISFTPSVTASYTLSTAGSSFDTVMAVYTGSAVNDLGPAVPPPAVSCNDDVSLTLLSSQLSITLNSGTTYYIQITGYNGAYGQYYFRIQQGAIALAGLPVLAAPATGIVLNDNTPLVDWNAATGGYTYEVQLATSAAFTPATLVGFGTFPASINTDLTLTLPAPGTYYWRVRALNTNGVPGLYSAARSIVYRTAPPNPSLPAANFTTTDTTPLFSWATYGAGAKYDLQVSTDSTFTAVEHTFSNITTLNFTPSLPADILTPGIWHWRVQAHDVMGVGVNSPTGYSTHRTLNINNLSLPAANLVAADTTPMFTWLAHPGANVRYKLEIDDDPNFGSLEPESQTNLTALTYTLPAPIANSSSGNGIFYWRVKVSTDGGTNYQANSPLNRRLNISPPAPLAPLLVAPAASAATIDTTVQLDWNATATLPANGGPFEYEVQVCSNLTCTVMAQPPVITANTDLVTAALTPNTTYYWRVRTMNVIGLAGAFSPARAFIVKTALLTLPADNAATIDTTPIFSWAAVPYQSILPPPALVPVKYRLEIYTDPGPGGTLFAKDNLATPTYTLLAGEALTPGDYYWRVQVNVDGDGDYDFTSSDLRKVAITTAVPLAPTFPAVPAIGATFADTTPTLPWNALVPPPTSGWTVASYDVQISTVPTFATTEVSVNVPALPTTFTPGGALSVGTHYWRVRAVNSHGAAGAFSAARSFIIRTNPPVLSAPAEGLVTIDTTPLFTWLSFGIGARYNIEIDNSPGCGSPEVTNGITPLTTASFTSPLLAEDAWYWHVQAVDALGEESAFSVCRTLYVRTSTALAAPVLFAPATGASFNVQPTLDWNPVTPPVGVTLDHYEVQIATNALFTIGLQPPANVDDTLSAYTTSGLTTGTYYWRVRAFNSNGIPGGFSLARTVIFDTTAPTTKPTLSAPINNSSSTIKLPTFLWTKPLTATKFELRYSLNYPAGYTPNTGFQLNTVGTVIVPNIALTSFKWPSPLLPGTYYWQVQAYDAAGNSSGWTNLGTFKINSATTDTPVPHHFGVGDPILLTWGPLSWVCTACPNTNGYYEVQIDNNITFTSPEYTRVGAPSPTGGITELAYRTANYGVVIPDAALPNGTWYWRVRGFNPTVLPSGAYGAYSTTGTFTVEK